MASVVAGEKVPSAIISNVYEPASKFTKALESLVAKRSLKFSVQVPRSKKQETETPEVPVYRAEDTTESVVSSQEQATQEPIVFDPWEKLGLQEDDYAKQLIDAYKTNQLDEFLIKTNTNYDLYTDEEIIKTQIDSKYPSFGEEEKNLILQKTLQKEYGITGDEDDDKVARLMMKLEADKIRDGLKAEQSQYKPKTFENEASKFEAQLKAINR